MFGCLRTSRLTIRPLDDCDIYPLYEYRHLNEVKKYQSWDFYTVEKARQLVFRNKTQPFDGYMNNGNFAVVYEGKMIGDIFVGASPTHPFSVSIGYTFSPEYWHQGFAREAVKAMILHLFVCYQKEQIEAYVMDGNIASMRLLLSLGFELINYDEKYGDYYFRLLKR